MSAACERNDRLVDGAPAPSCDREHAILSRLPAVLVFGGTSEGRAIAEWLGERGTCQVLYSALTEYGGSLVEGVPHLQALTGAMPPPQMEALMRDRSPVCVIDATHPYAASVSGSIARSAQATGVPLLRVLREGEPEGTWTEVDDVHAAAVLAARTEGRVLLTTGSKDLPVYVGAMEDFADRLFVRILPVASSLEAAAALGIPTSHIVAMQGPFSKGLNVALLRELNIDMMVTKASGAAGGFWEKADAARECGVRLVVIRRPVDEDGVDVEELKRMLESAWGI